MTFKDFETIIMLDDKDNYCNGDPPFQEDTMKAQEQEMSPAKIIIIQGDSVKLFEDKKYLDEVLERVEPFIHIEVEKRASNLSPEKVNEIKQNVRIKLWRALQQRVIQNPVAYTRVIIKSVFGDLGRESKRLYSLSCDDYGEVIQGSALVNLSEGWDNPEYIVEQEETTAHRLQVIVEAISLLPPRQRQAIVCSLLQRIDNATQLKKVFELYQVPIEMEDWPDDPEEVQRLKALVSIARRKIAQFMNNGVSVSRGNVSNAFPFSNNKEVIETKVL